MDFSERLFRYSNANDVTFSVKIYLIANWRICRSQPDAVVLASLPQNSCYLQVSLYRGLCCVVLCAILAWVKKKAESLTQPLCSNGRIYRITR